MELLLAKTLTSVAEIYRLIKFGGARRVLFLVDRSALGEQAQNAFKEMRLEQSQPFSEIFEVKELSDLEADTSTRVHVANVRAGRSRRNPRGARPGLPFLHWRRHVAVGRASAQVAPRCLPAAGRHVGGLPALG